MQTDAAADAMKPDGVRPDEGAITSQDRVVPSDMESAFLCAHLVVRLRWAVKDAHATPSLGERDGEHGCRPTRPAFPAA